MTTRSIAATTAFAALSLVAGTTFCAGVASAEEVAAAPAKVAAAPSLDTRVCAKVELPGSRIARTVCQTRGQWISAQGVDPIAK